MPAVPGPRCAVLVAALLITVLLSACGATSTAVPSSTQLPSSRASSSQGAMPSVEDSPTAEPSPETSPSPSAENIDALVERGSAIASVEWVADQPSLEGGILNDVIRLGDRLVAVGSDGGASGEPRHAASWTSTDGRSWQPARLPAADAEPFPTFVGLPGAGGLVAVATDGQQLVAVGGAGAGYGPEMEAIVWASADGVSWEAAAAHSSFAGSFMLDVAAFDGGWVAVGVHESADGNQAGAIWHSTDGLSWRPAEAALTGPATAIARLGAGLVLLANDPNVCRNCIVGGTHVFLSGDGLSWTQVPDEDLPGEFGALNLEPVGVGLVTVGAAMINYDLPVGNRILETRDGEAWREVTPLPVGNLSVRKLVASQDGVFLAGSLVPHPGCCAYPAFWQLRDGAWDPVLPDRQITEGSVSVTGAAIAPDGSIVAVGHYQANFPDGSCCVIRGVVAIASMPG